MFWFYNNDVLVWFFFVCLSSHFEAAKITQALTFESSASGIKLDLDGTLNGQNSPNFSNNEKKQKNYNNTSFQQN